MASLNITVVHDDGMIEKIGVVEYDEALIEVNSVNDVVQLLAHWVVPPLPDQHAYTLLLAAAKDFIYKCENGQAKSVRSYAKMLEAVRAAEGKPSTLLG